MTTKTKPVPTFRQLAKLEPRLTALLKEAKAVRDDRQHSYFCAYPSKEIFEAAQKYGFTEDNCYRAKKRLQGKVCAALKQFQGVWHWGIGNPSDWTIRPPKSPNSGEFALWNSPEANSPPKSPNSPDTEENTRNI